MAGVLAGFVNVAVANTAVNVPILYEVLSIPPELVRPMGIDVANPLVYMLSFIAFWVIVLGTAGRIMAARHQENG